MNRLSFLILLALASHVLAGDPSVTDSPVLLSPEESKKRIQMYEGYEINLFASEEDFPISNPVAMKWDAKGRLWVANNPTYPHIKPDQEYQDSIVILEDTDGDGKADKHTVFAEGLYLPIGFAIGDGGCYVSAEPNLLHLIDTDGDDVADESHVILHGFGSEDSHHALSAYQWAPDGSFYFCEGTFLVSNVETPWGPKRTHDSAVFRYKPSVHRLDVFSNYGWSNPWGMTFDKWGHPILMDASPGRNYYLPHLMQNFALDQIGHTSEYPGKHKIEELSFFKKGRPNSGAEFVSSHNFPADVQGTYLNGQCIGFHGIRWVWIEEKGSGYFTTRTEDLLTSHDTTFRPVDLMFGPDSALYVLDYYNPIVGHMQYEFRDQRRDSTHGRIWRVTHKDGALTKQPKIAGEAVAALLELLKDPIDRTRFHARRELQERDWAQVGPALEAWIQNLDATDPNYDLYRLEGYWIYQGHDRVHPPLLEALLQAAEPNVRASATRALRFELERLKDPYPYLETLIVDPNMRVRLEAVNALSCLNSARAARTIMKAAELPMDAGLYHAMRRALEYLERFGDYAEGETLFTVRATPTKDLLALLEENWTELVALELLTRKEVKGEAANAIISKFQERLGKGRVETLFMLTDRLLNSGATTSISGLASQFAGATPEEAAEAEATVKAWLNSETSALAPLSIQQAAYTTLLLNPDVEPSKRIEMASRREELALLSAGASRIRTKAAVDRLWPVLSDYVAANAADLSSEIVRDALQIGVTRPDTRAKAFEVLAKHAESPTDSLKRGAIAAMRTVPYKEWPKGYDAYAGPLRIDPKKLRLGRELYAREGYCGQCHQSSGEGVAGAFPPLHANAWVEGDVERLIKITQAGLVGELDIHGVTYASAMPPMGIMMSEEEFAAVLSYVRTSWDNLGDEVTVDQINKVREDMKGRAYPYTVEEILKEHPLPESK